MILIASHRPFNDDNLRLFIEMSPILSPIMSPIETTAIVRVTEKVAENNSPAKKD